jgi:hypothetical protein
MNDKQQEQGSSQQNAGQQNPTLNEKGTRVADYGNVMGGSANDTVEQGQNSGNQERSGNSSEQNQTLGNP